MSLDLAFFEAARARIGSRLVRTPMIALEPAVIPEGRGVDARGVVTAPAVDPRLSRPLWLKLECTQIAGSFKARGALSRLLALPPEHLQRGVVTASGGNHGLAVAFAARSLGVPATVFLPRSTPPAKVERIARWGAEVVVAGEVWDDAHAAGLARAASEGRTYVHPFADPDIVAGQGTLALEIFEQAPQIDLLVVAIGGGGLAAGVGAAAKLLRPDVRVLGVEPVGAPTLAESLRAGHVVELASIQTKAGTLAPRRSDPYTFEIIRSVVDEIVLVTDEAMRDAARLLFETAYVGVELSGAAALAGFLAAEAAGSALTKEAKQACILVCGAGTDAFP